MPYAIPIAYHLAMRFHAVFLLPILLWPLAFSETTMSDEKPKLNVLIIDGQMNRHHNMAVMSQAVKDYLEQTGLFEVDYVSTPPQGADMSSFAPGFGEYELVVLNYDGDAWPGYTQKAFERFVRDGGGLVSVHSSDNAFPGWPAFLEMTGVGGWGGRDERWGPAVYWGEDGLMYDHGPGQAFHPRQHEFSVTFRNPGHPVTRGLPETWMHGKDELYSGLRGPAENLDLLATGFADPSLENTSDRHEPVLMAVSYGKGRVFHTTLGHVGKNETSRPASIRCAGFITTFQRGAEWAASGRVSQPVPGDFPAPDRVSLRD